MAEGFLQQAKGSFQLTFEDIGNEYFDYLLTNSLLQDVEKEVNGCFTSCKMHDLVHDLAQSISKSKTDDTSHIQSKNVFDAVNCGRLCFQSLASSTS